VGDEEVAVPPKEQTAWAGHIRAGEQAQERSGRAIVLEHGGAGWGGVEDVAAHIQVVIRAEHAAVWGAQIGAIVRIELIDERAGLLVVPQNAVIGPASDQQVAAAG